MLGQWRPLIDANRPISAIHGIARWKRITADVLLWDGTGPVRHAAPGKAGRKPHDGNQVLAWITRSDAAEIAELEARGIHVGEIEDGMIRSKGLGANCVPPLSIVVDPAGPHFDPAQASSLETILQSASIDGDLLTRAQDLRERLVTSGISKYEQDSDRPTPATRPDARRQVLVTGQVEDDRSVLCGGAGLDNLELVRRTRLAEPDAWIIFKPHPDVEAGHRKGLVPDARALEFVDEIDRSSSIAALLDRVDAIHVLTSLAGFEALMRGLDVITHGVPFYAGWGLTRDLGPVPARRMRQRSLDELVAATLILYPRYVDPVTRLPCSPELLVERIASGNAEVKSPLIGLREFQGRLNRLFRWTNGR
jgi:capsular polysaccharide export protein